MIDISNGLLPDLKAEELAKKEKNKKQQKIIAEFSYDNTLEETDDAIKVLQKNFSLKRGKLSIIAYSLLAVSAIVAIVFNSTQGFNVTQIVLYFALAFCAYGLYFALTEKKRTRKAVLATIMKMNPEEYRCTIFDDRVEIETIIKPKDEEKSEASEEKSEVEEDKSADDLGDSAEDVENVDEDFQPIKCVFKFGEDMLDFLENDISMFLVIARRQTYCFPKRCLSDEQQTTIREFLSKKLSSLDF